MARRERKRPVPRQSAVSRALTRKARPFGTGTSADQTARLTRALGRQETARRLGVSDRTLRRYLAGGTPSKRNAARLAEAVRTSPEVRRQAVAPLREARLRNRGAYVRIAGMIGGSPGGKRKNWRHMTIGEQTPIHLSGGQMSEILDAFEAGNDDEALDLLREHVGEAYGFGGIRFEDLTLLEFLRDNPGWSVE